MYIVEPVESKIFGPGPDLLSIFGPGARTRLIKIVRPGPEPATSLHAQFSRNFFLVFTSGGRSKN